MQCESLCADYPHHYSRYDLIGSLSHWKISDLGIVQYRHSYDLQLLRVIRDKATALKEQLAAKRHLNLKYIRGAQKFIPEINDLVHATGRLDRLGQLAGTPLEPYPISVISTIVTFMGPDDGAIEWHADGSPVTELIPLAIDGAEGGELEVYRGNADEGMARLALGQQFSPEEIIGIDHRMGYGVFGQFLRVLHRVVPMRAGRRIVLNLNLRSIERPHVDDNTLTYLGADNPSFDWIDELLEDVRERHLPAYLGQTKADP